MNDKLLELLKLESKEINLSFEKASIEGQGTPQEVSDRRENAFVRTFIEKYFPFPYRVTKGNVVDSYNNRSNSIDCLILSPSHPYTIDPKNDKASIIFADGVDFAIEVKPDLTSKNEIVRGLEQIRSVKRLRRQRDGLLIKSKCTELEISRAKQIPAIIFSNKTFKNIKTLLADIVDYYVNEKVPKNEQFDLIVINNQTIIFNSTQYSYTNYVQIEGLYYAETNENTLAAFLMLIGKMSKSEPSLGSNVLDFYLDESLINELVRCYPDLNEKLQNQVCSE